ncbi:MAG: hypothetical protein VB070_08905 [Clostridiaceae bacterium]|nr:hypothetical protein [Clostridiaceae bacterium]
MKITLVGGGSYSWTDSLFASFLGNPFFDHETELCLYDMNEKALSDLQAYCAMYNQAFPDLAIRVTTTTSLDQSLNGADYVIAAISHGGLKAELEDHYIARRHGFYNVKGSEAGIAGASRTIRHVPELVRIARRMRELCPDARFLNVTNPLTALTRAITKYTGIEAIGFCHGIKNHLELLLPYIGAKSVSELNFEVAGIDHCSFLLDVKYHQQDVFELLRGSGRIEAAWRGESSGTYDDPFAGRENQRIRFILWDILGYLPGLSDEHCAEFYYQVIGTPALREKFNMHYDRIADRTKSANSARENLLAAIKAGPKPAVPTCSEILDRFIEAINGGRPLHDVLNYRNYGQVPNLPLDTVVETWCYVDSTGIHPEITRPMPKIVESIVRPMALREELYMEAAMEQDERKLVSALAMDPIVNDFLQIKQVAHEIMEYNSQFLIK